VVEISGVLRALQVKEVKRAMPSIETQFERMGTTERLLRGPVCGFFCMVLGIGIVAGAAANTDGLGGGGAAILIGLGVMLFLICGVYACWLGYSSRGGRTPTDFASVVGVQDYPPPPPPAYYPQPQQPYYYGY